jgi:two-component system, cell cycle sensor histidine kinase and response regulator CckA
VSSATSGGGELADDVPTGRGETILLVEDDADVAAVVARMLTGNGYDVVQASSGEQGLEEFDKHRERIRLVLADVVMPGMGGIRLGELVRARDPGTKVLYCSGYPGLVLAHPGFRLGVDQWLEKPFDVRTLLGKIRDLLDSG